MIELIQAPAVNRVIADGNETLIKINSSSSGGYFLRALIFIDDDPDPFLSQSWSKDEQGLSVFNIKHLYYAYFENYFTPDLQPGFNPHAGLFKKVKIILKEYAVGSEISLSTLELPIFYLIKNHKPQIFNDQLSVSILDLPQENIKVPRSGGIIFPLFLKSGPSLTVKILDDKQNIISTSELLDYESQITSYHIDFNEMALQAYPFIFVKFETSQDSALKKIVFIQENIYPVKQLFYLNNFGVYCLAYLTGKKSISHDLAPMSYTQFDGSDVTYDVEDNKEIELSSGFGYNDITALIHTIARSLDVRLLFDGNWERVRSETKKISKYADNQFIYEDLLKFSRINLPDFTNEQAYGIRPILEDLVKTGDENDVIEISKAELLDLFTATQSATRMNIRDLPINGKLSFENDQGVFALSDMAANTPGIIPYIIDLATLIKISYQPDQTLFGAPLDEIAFQMGPDVLWSNIAAIKFNVIDIPDANLPPAIQVNTIQEIALDANGAASQIINAIISDPEGDPVEILWEVLNGAPITFDDPTISAPIMTLTGAASNTVYDIKVTATDTNNNLTATKTIKVITSSYLLEISGFASAPGTADEIDYDVNLTGGQPNQNAVISFNLQAFAFDQTAVIFLNDPNEKILSGGGSGFLEQITLSSSGSLNFQVKLQNISMEYGMTLTIRIESVEGNQFINENKKQITLQL